MKCIFCLKERAPSDEHVFPEAIGGTLVIHRVCKPCNDILGSQADAKLVDHMLIILGRAECRIKRKGGTVPDALEALGAGRLVSDPEQRIAVSTPSEGGKPILKLVTRKVTGVENGQKFVRLKVDRQNLPHLGPMTQKVRVRAGMPPLSESELAGELTRAIESSHTIVEPQIIHHPQIDLIYFQRGIFKIVYELAWYWLGDDFLEDAEAAKLREVVLNPASIEHPESTGIIGTIKFGDDAGQLLLWKLRPYAHLGMAIRSGSNMMLTIRIFNTMSAIVCVSKNGDRYPNFAASPDGQFIEIDPRQKTERQSTILAEVDRLTAENLALGREPNYP
jgi:HNH endonuclease